MEPIYQEALEENQKRVESNPNYYRLRQQVTEHQFGTLKRQWGFTFTLMKGKENVLSEVNLIMICYNLRRLMSIFTIKELKNRLKGLMSIRLSFIGRFLVPVTNYYTKTIRTYSFDFTNFKMRKGLVSNY